MDFKSKILIKGNGKVLFVANRYDKIFEDYTIYKILEQVYFNNKSRVWKLSEIELWQRIEWIDSGDIEELRMCTIKLYQQAWGIKKYKKGK